jgi:hypothetical protein
MMRRYCVLLVMACFIFILADDAVAKEKPTRNPTVMIPAGTMSSIIKEILPFKIDLGKHFPKNIWIKSIDDLKIKQDKFFFRVLIYGENVDHALKLGDQTINLKIGKVSLRYRCEAAFRFDPAKGILYLTPNVKDITSQADLGKGNMILSPLLEAMSDIEYPIAIQKIEPLITRLGEKNLSIKIDIAKVYSGNDMLFVEVVPKVTEKKPKPPTKQPNAP